MKLPFTEKFLWTVYNFIENADRTFDLLSPRTIRETVYPDIFTMRKEYNRWESKRHFSNFLAYLKANRLIKIKELENKTAIVLTQKGCKRVLRLKMKMLKKNKRKDGRWQMITFDIPEHKKKTRDIFRKNLQYLGYNRLQKSIWVSPYDVYSETKIMVENYFIAPYVRFFLIEEVDI